MYMWCYEQEQKRLQEAAVIHGDVMALDDNTLWLSSLATVSYCDTVVFIIRKHSKVRLVGPHQRPGIS